MQVALALAELVGAYEEGHEEGDYGRARVDDQLPSIGVVEIGAANAPDDDDEAGDHEDGERAGGDSIRDAVRQRPAVLVLLVPVHCGLEALPASVLLL